MASRNQAAISSDEKLLLLVVGIIISTLLFLGIIFGVASGVASGIAGFLHKAGLPEGMAMDVYRVIRWGVIGLLLFIFMTTAAKILSR